MSKDVCDEMTVEIFSRLPTKSLLRFRAVSKSLCARIGSPAFIRLHALRSPKKFLCIHQDGYKDEGIYKIKNFYTFHSEGQLPYNSYMGINPIKYPFIDARSAFGSCNGILCLRAFGKGVTLWNPSTRRKVAIRDPRTFRGDSPVYGFGYDPVIQDYKILRISHPTLYVCTVKTRTWRKIASPNECSRVTSYQCLFNGALHWVETHVRTLLFDKYTYYDRHIMTFDFSSEVCSSIELPEPTWETSGLAVIKGSLAVISRISVRHNDCTIWVRREYNDTSAFWSVAFKLNTVSYGNQVDRFFQLTATDDLLLDPYGRGIKVYNPETEVLSQLADFSASSHILGMYICVESLELLDMGTSCYQRKQIARKNIKPKK
ncbi:putative F-box domain-containing protein [Helianthus debilis subsp. tardiflorus]